MNKIYMDNGATSFPKAPKVSEAMCNYIEKIGTNVGRGAYENAFQAQRIIEETREMLCKLFNFPTTSNVIFTKNITESMNVMLKGLLKDGDHVIVSPLEHNAVMRPLTSLASQGVSFDKAACDIEGHLVIDSIEPLIKANTKAIVMTHASNVCGTILDLEAVGKIAKKHKLFFIIDGAQTAGLVDIDMARFNADAFAFTGHKGLLGPQGTGGFLIHDALANEIPPFIEGGTGSKSDSEEQPMYLPDKYESGTPNTVGLFGLHAALSYLSETGIEKIRDIEHQRTLQFIEGIKDLADLRIVGTQDINRRTAVVSLDFSPRDNAEISWMLEQNYGIATRVGMHCAPSAHKALETFPQGTVRFSFSSFTTEEEINIAIKAIKEIMA
ncbi:MAG: aminotransferase class V-fold PLP-dependent enzyme [Clostridia bacterium]|nr:aminotransferase class V-fold PLP-dependent enzyme [Clostridia bacterium]